MILLDVVDGFEYSSPGEFILILKGISMFIGLLFFLWILPLGRKKKREEDEVEVPFYQNSDVLLQEKRQLGGVPSGVQQMPINSAKGKSFWVQLLIWVLIAFFIITPLVI